MADFSEPVTDPAVTDPEPVADPTAPVTDPAAPATETETPEPFDFSRFGEGVDEPFVTQAIQTQRALATEEGITDFFVQAGIALGLTPDQLTQLFDTPSPIADPETPPEPDKPLTKEDVLALIKEAALDPIAQQQVQQQTQVIRGVIDSSVKALDVADEERDAVLRAADKYLTNEADFLDADKVKEAIAKGKADFDALIEAAAKRRFDVRAREGEQLPTPLAGGNTGGGEAVKEPATVDEAKARVRAALKANGLLG